MKNQLKNLLSTAFLGLVLLVGLSANAQKKTVDMKQLPEKAKLFLTKHFPDQAVTTVTEDKDTFSTDYTVLLDNGMEVDFDKKGNWEEVDGKNKAIPTAVIPEAIATYLGANYATGIPVKLDKGARDYEVKLDSGTELKFGLDGKFLRIDD